MDAARAVPGVSAHADESARLRRELQALHETALALSEQLDRDALLERIVERAAALIEGSYGYLYLLEDEGRQLAVRIAYGPFEEFKGMTVERGEGVAGVVWATGRPHVENDYRTSGVRLLRLGDATPDASFGVPLTIRGELVGVIGLAHIGEGRFSDQDVELMARFGQLASLALERAQLTAGLQAELEERGRAEDELTDTVARLSTSTHELRRSHEETVRRLAAAAESRDASTARHVERMSQICELIARRLGLEEAFCEAIRTASALHDIGKIGIADAVLLKPGSLTDAERAEMEEHSAIGHRILAGSDSELLDLAASIALTHHERYDGTGYPQGLTGDAIPIEGRIAAVADVFDALTCDRVYRRAFPADAALEILRGGRGSQFDPVVLDVFLTAGDEFPEPRAMQSYQPAPRERWGAAPNGFVSEEAIEEGVRAALAEIVPRLDPRHGIDRALARFCQTAGDGVLASVYVLNHDRLWCVAQNGYDQVRDGFEIGQGVMSRVIATSTYQFVPDAGADPDFIAAMPDIVSELSTPIVSASATAVFNVETMGARLTDGCVEPLERLAAALRPLVEELGGFRFDVPTLMHMAVYASTLRGVPAISEFATRALGRLLDLEAAQLDLGERPVGAPVSFWRRDTSGLRPIPAEWVNATSSRLGLAEMSWSTLDALEVAVPDGHAAARWLVWLPLRVGGSHVGTLIGRSKRVLHLERDQIEAATLFAQHIAALLDVANALRREQRAAITDALTGLLNRRGFDERLREEIERAQRGDRTLALLIADCDDLKRINDESGHEQGDAVLQAIAKVIRECKRAPDVAARLGGDEFGIVLTEADGSVALDVAERLRRAMTTLSVVSNAPSASFGFAVYPTHGTTAAELMRVADRALYEAKRSGKNRLTGPTS